MSGSVHRVRVMAGADVAEPDADPIDPLTGWLDDMLAGLAEGVAEAPVARHRRGVGCDAN